MEVNIPLANPNVSPLQCSYVVREFLKYLLYTRQQLPRYLMRSVPIKKSLYDEVKRSDEMIESEINVQSKKRKLTREQKSARQVQLLILRL